MGEPYLERALLGYKGDMIMPTVDIVGIATHYEISGSSLPLLMMACILYGL